MKNKTKSNNPSNQEKNYGHAYNTENNREESNSKNGINLDYDYNTEYGDGDIPDVDK